jgi:hypothetical protein
MGEAVIEHLVFFAAVAAAAALFALVEIQIEGADGWAARLPTWKVDNRWTRWFYSGRPLTGYHLYIQLFVLLFVHLPFLTSLAAPSWTAEARVISFMTFFWLAEDFLWFVFNPAFGIRNFRKERIWWHARSWWWIMPRDYWIFTAVGALLYAFSLTEAAAG